MGQARIVARTPDEFESRLRDYLRERAEETRAVRVGLKKSSDQAAIVSRYADLFTIGQLVALREAEEVESAAAERERVHRLRKMCESGLIVTQLAPLQDALTNSELVVQVEFRGESLPLRTAIARVSVLADYAEREELGKRAMDASAELNDQRHELVRAAETLRAELTDEPDPIARSDAEKGISLRHLGRVLADASSLVSDAYADLRRRWLDRLLGTDRPPEPSSYHASYMHRLSPLADIYTKERATEICLATLAELGFDLTSDPNIHTDLADRPQKAPRPVVIPSDPPTLVHLITRPQGGLQDYVAFLHEAGHALHFAGCDSALPYAFRRLSRDNALTEIYSYTLQAITREPGWHARHFELSADEAETNAEAARFIDALIFRRNVAKLHFELEFWSRFATDGGTAEGYAERLTEATGLRYRSDRYLADMDPDFYSADYLRAAIRSAQVRAHLRERIGASWWRSQQTGDFLRGLFLRGTRPSNEEIAQVIGYEADDTRPLVAELRMALGEQHPEVRPA